MRCKSSLRSVRIVACHSVARKFNQPFVRRHNQSLTCFYARDWNVHTHAHTHTHTHTHPNTHTHQLSRIQVLQNDTRQFLPRSRRCTRDGSPKHRTSLHAIHTRSSRQSRLVASHQHGHTTDLAQTHRGAPLAAGPAESGTAPAVPLLSCRPGWSTAPAAAAAARSSTSSLRRS